MKKYYTLLLISFVSIGLQAQTWQLITFADYYVEAYHPGNNGRIIIGGPQFIKYSDDLGDSWTHAYTPTNTVIKGFAQKGNTIYAQGLYGLYISSDNGQSWSMIDDRNYKDIVAYNNSIFLLGYNSYLYKTSDDINYDSIYTGVEFQNTFDINSSGLIIVAGMTEVSSSTDGGATWTKDSSWTEVREVIFDANDVLYIAEQTQGLHRSFDNGTTVTKISSSLPSNAYYRSLYIDKYNNLLYGYNGGLAITGDKGNNWDIITGNMCGFFLAEPFAMGQNSDGYYFISCSSVNVFRSTTPNVSIKEIEPNNMLANISPVPAGDLINIRFVKNDDYKIIISDIRGSTLLEKSFNGQSTSVKLDNFSSGIYILKVIGETGIYSSSIIVQK